MFFNCEEEFSALAEVRIPNDKDKKRLPHAVAKRNARERRRVQAVNNAFIKLRNVVPIHNDRGKRISKVKTLLLAIDYIQALNRILRDYDEEVKMFMTCHDNCFIFEDQWSDAFKDYENET